MSLTLDDRSEIEALHSRYCYLIDAGKPEDWAGLFTADAVFVIKGTPGEPDREVRGTAELVTFAQGLTLKFQRRGIRHAMSNIIVEPTQNGARGRSYTTVLRVGDQQPPQVTTSGRYDDQFERTQGGWRFKLRVFQPDF